MKKLLVIAALATFTVSANAQYAPKQGDISTEISFKPFASEGDVFGLKGDVASIQGRYFFSDKNAIRLKLGFGLNNTTENNTFTKYLNSTNQEIVLNPDSKVPYTKSEGTTETKKKATSFSINLGYERHFKVHDRVDLYAGAEVGYFTTSISGTETGNKTSTAYDADWKPLTSTAESSTTEYTCYDGATVNPQYSQSGLSVGIFTGIDFYVYKGLYLGAELGLAFKNGTNRSIASYTENGTKAYTDFNTAANNYTTNYNYSSETGLTTATTAHTGAVAQTSTLTGSIKTTEQTSTSLKFYVEPAIRLGWKF